MVRYLIRRKKERKEVTENTTSRSLSSLNVAVVAQARATNELKEDGGDTEYC
jgi:hypothetical protein